MPPSIRILQNCFLPEQLLHCSFEPYLNARPQQAEERYLFFESAVISRLVLEGWHRQVDYFGVLGHAWSGKLSRARSCNLPIRNLSRGPLTAAAVTGFIGANSDADVISLGRFVAHPVGRVAERIHPGWLKATGRLLACLGIRFDLLQTTPRPIYYNYFVGRRDWMENYVRDLLAPAIEAACHDPELRRLCFHDAGYIRPWPAELATVFGIRHYPLHAFIGERLVNIYAMLAGTRVRSYEQHARPGSRVVSGARLAFHQARWNLRQQRQRLAGHN